jgi:hypothetical protein
MNDEPTPTTRLDPLVMRPCPFCGEPVHIICNEVIRGTVAYTNFGCDSCAAQAPESCDSRTDVRLQQAVDHWNQRAEAAT